MRSLIPLLILLGAFATQASAAPTVHSLRAGDSKPVDAVDSPVVLTARGMAARTPFLTTREATLLPDGRIETRCGQAAADLRDFRFRAVGEADGVEERRQ
ncbi:MAG TPA: hypothetical protein PKZ76_18615 [Xanthomonadaceae bacterium]|nr:hypothetical protein [Xanthomonadaceae bacterium]